MTPDPAKVFGQFPGARHIGSEELAYVSQVLASRSPYRFYGMDLQGFCPRFETALAEAIEQPHCLAVSSGTAALHTALVAAGVGRGDEVIVPAYGWSADLMAIVAVEAVPVIVPVDSTLSLDPSQIGDAIRPKTRAVLAIHMRGYPCDMPAIRDAVAGRAVIIEDCAQCYGGTIDGHPTGSFGDIAVFSFQYNKTITSGEGGAIATSDAAMHERARRFHDLGMARAAGARDPVGKEAIRGFGLNYRMSELHAAVMLAQLEKFPTIHSALKQNWQAAVGLLQRIPDVQVRANRFDICPNYACVGFHRSPGASHEDFVKRLKGAGIPVQSAGDRDPHHYKTWVHFLEQTATPFRLECGEDVNEILATSYFAEISSIPV